MLTIQHITVSEAELVALVVIPALAALIALLPAPCFFRADERPGDDDRTRRALGEHLGEARGRPAAPPADA